MNKDTNIAEILKDAPNNTKLYSPIYGEVIFERLRTDNKTIEVSVDNTCKHFDYYGRVIWHNLSNVMLTGEECLLFPSKDNIDWSTFKVPKKHKHFEPFQKVLVASQKGLVASGKTNTWEPDIYRFYDTKNNIHRCMYYYAVRKETDIIPYEGNEDKLGKSIETK